MVKRILRAFLGLLFLPIVVASSQTFRFQLSAIGKLSKNQLYFFVGIGAYIILHLIFYKPAYLYVLGHELVHAFSTWICGGEVKSFRVSSTGGSVSTTKSNLFILLAPYFFPVYTIGLSLVYFIGSFFRDLTLYLPFFLFLIGFSLTFHLILTADSLRTKQTDTLKTGYFFSISLVYIVNLTVVAFILSLLSPNISFSVFLTSTLSRSKDIYLAIFKQLF